MEEREAVVTYLRELAKDYAKRAEASRFHAQKERLVGEAMMLNFHAKNIEEGLHLLTPAERRRKLQARFNFAPR